MRRIIVKPRHMEWSKEDNRYINAFEQPFEAWFHQWGSEFQEFESGPGNYSVAIIELDSGEVKTVVPEWVTFKVEENQ